MVSSHNIHLFVGQDIIGPDGTSKKDAQIKNILNSFIPPHLKDFNFDTLEARRLSLSELQEKLLNLPLKAKCRVLLIRRIEFLAEKIKHFILEYVKKPHPYLILILDTDRYNPKDNFIGSISRYSRLYHFKEPLTVDTFTLGRKINLHSASEALRILKQLLERGENTEMILGGLRYTCERDIASPVEKKRRIRLLLGCDRDIKRGRLKANFALEKLVVELCQCPRLF